MAEVLAILTWGMIFGTLTRGLQWLLGDPGPRWLPLASSGLAWLPISGMALGQWLSGLTSSFSIPLLLLTSAIVLQPLCQRPLLDRRARLTAWWFACLGGFVLYPWNLGLSLWDPYSIGWQMWGPLGTAVISVILLARRNRFGLVLLAAGVAWQFQWLESSNAWDYLIDPILVLSSLVALTGYYLLQGVSGFRQSSSLKHDFIKARLHRWDSTSTGRTTVAGTGSPPANSLTE